MTLLESGARALATKYGLDWEDLHDDPEHEGVHDFSCRAFWLGMSRAYLEGIREPAHALLSECWGHGGGWTDTQDAMAFWQAMIGAALKE